MSLVIVEGIESSSLRLLAIELFLSRYAKGVTWHCQCQPGLMVNCYVLGVPRSGY